MILLDTHVLVWLDAGNQKLGRRARHQIDRALRGERLFVSAISFWEAAMLQQQGRLELGVSADQWRDDLLHDGMQEVSIDGSVGVRAATLSGVNGDPADRLIVSTALSGYTLVTADKNLLAWTGDLKRLDATK